MVDTVHFVEANVGSESTRITYVFYNQVKMNNFIDEMKKTGVHFDYNIRKEVYGSVEDPFERYCGSSLK